MLITRTSLFSGFTRTREIDVTEEQLRRWKSGELIQNVMPHLSDLEREFLLTGVTEDEWNEEFGSKEEDDE